MNVPLLTHKNLRGAAPHVLGHAHNDEMQAEPLGQALRDGFTSLEVDVHLVQGRLLVGHTYKDAVQKNLSLEQGYLAPLQQRVQQQGAVYPEGPEVTLMLDFKGDAESTYQALKPLLSSYAGMLVHSQGGESLPGAVKVVITGNKPKVEGCQERSVFLDASVNEALLHPNKINAQLSPTVSGNYRVYFRWNGEGTMPANEQSRLEKMAEDMHALGLQLRLWDAPDQPNAWSTFARLGVDRINTDDLDGFARWHMQRYPIGSPAALPVR